MLTRRIYASRSGCILALVLLSLGEPCCAIFKRNDHCDTAPGAILGYAAGSSSSSRSDGEVHGSTAMHRNGRSLSAGNPKLLNQIPTAGRVCKSKMKRSVCAGSRNAHHPSSSPVTNTFKSEPWGIHSFVRDAPLNIGHLRTVPSVGKRRNLNSPGGI